MKIIDYIEIWQIKENITNKRKNPVRFGCFE